MLSTLEMESNMLSIHEMILSFIEAHDKAVDNVKNIFNQLIYNTSALGSY